MARLNEPITATESIETLRRKFLRQNRDIARINSTQSLKIRALENECARMLSENLDLRGQILRLETELQDSRAQRIADHALEIKEKMEAQLLEWGTMLASLGSEPIRKSRSPRVSKKAKTRPSMVRTSPPQWRRRSSSEMEAAALQEGRLPPLWENKPCPPPREREPRETLNREEIMALWSQGAETNDSPDLGPPPVSRFVDEDPVKIDLPVKSPSVSPKPASVEASLCKPLPTKEMSPCPPALQKKVEETPKEAEIVKKVESKSSKPTQSAPTPVLTPVPTPSTTPTPESQPTAAQAAKAGLKRKTREDDAKENPKCGRAKGDAAKSAASEAEKPSSDQNRTTARPMKELPSRREAREKAAGTATRKPLGARNANEAVGAEKKSAKSAVVDEVVKAKAEVKREEQAKERTKAKKKDEAKKPIEIVPIPELAPPAPIASIEVEPEALSAEPTNLLSPASPAPEAPREDMRDTPPPLDISSSGETSRASRRNRAAISYAEPNLRDKMRRPTKQLFDAVAGEGKSMQRRTSHSSGPSSAVKSEVKELSAAESMGTEAPASPLAQKTARTSPADDLPTSVVMDRKKHVSSGADQGAESDSASSSTSKSSRPNRRLEEIAARELEVAKMFEGSSDVYEFPSSSPSNESKHSNPAGGKKGATGKGHGHLRSRRLSSVIREDLGLEGAGAETNNNEKGHNSAASSSRKRASMMVQKVSKLEPETADRDNSAEGDSVTSTSSAEADRSTRDSKVSTRRRSMML